MSTSSDAVTVTYKGEKPQKPKTKSDSFVHFLSIAAQHWKEIYQQKLERPISHRGNTLGNNLHDPIKFKVVIIPHSSLVTNNVVSCKRQKTHPPSPLPLPSIVFPLPPFPLVHCLPFLVRPGTWVRYSIIIS